MLQLRAVSHHQASALQSTAQPVERELDNSCSLCFAITADVTFVHDLLSSRHQSSTIGSIHVQSAMYACLQCTSCNAHPCRREYTWTNVHATNCTKDDNPQEMRCLQAAIQLSCPTRTTRSPHQLNQMLCISFVNHNTMKLINVPDYSGSFLAWLMSSACRARRTAPQWAPPAQCALRLYCDLHCDVLLYCLYRRNRRPRCPAVSAGVHLAHYRYCHRNCPSQSRTSRSCYSRCVLGSGTCSAALSCSWAIVWAIAV